jgi:hypothetical protein
MRLRFGDTGKEVGNTARIRTDATSQHRIPGQR